MKSRDKVIQKQKMDRERENELSNQQELRKQQRANIRERNRLCQASRLQNTTKRIQHNKLSAASLKRRLENEDARKKQYQMWSIARNKRFQVQNKKEQYLQKQLKLQNARLQKIPEARDKNRRASKINTKERHRANKNNKNYPDKNRLRAQLRLDRVSKDEAYKMKKRQRMYAARHSGDSNEKKSSITKKIYSAQQIYWLRRSKLLGAARQQKTSMIRQKKMATRSNATMLDVRLMFGLAEHRL